MMMMPTLTHNQQKEPSPLYLKDLYSCGNNMTTPTDGEDCEAKELLENKILVWIYASLEEI